MNHRNSLFTLRVALLVLLVIGVALFPARPAPALADGPAPDNATTTYEIKFMESMIDHHAMAVETGELCIQKAIHEELRAMCQSIVTTQSQEIALMQSWLQAWYGETYEPHMSPGAMRKMERMAAMDAEAFEIAFMEDMIKHHTKAIKEAETCVERAYHPELVSLCQDIIASQSAEIEQMQAWLCEWYGRCK